MANAADWVEGLMQAVADFERTRGAINPGVRLSLTDGESFFLSNARPAPGEELLILYPYPPGMTTDLPVGEDGYPVMPRVVIVSPQAIAKIELMAVPPGQREARFGLHAAEEPPPPPAEPEPVTSELRPPPPETGFSG
jgi:hypothetical protein